MSTANWKPISTAPKDREILVYGEGGVTSVSWLDWGKGNGYWTLCFCGSYADDGQFNATHWDELPEAPSE